MHTPGPWFADSSFVGARSIDRFFIKCSSKDLPGGVAEAEANARLIAAAPALLEALLDALPYVEDVLSDPAALACFKPGTVERHAKAIRAAISAATED